MPDHRMSSHLPDVSALKRNRFRRRQRIEGSWPIACDGAPSGTVVTGITVSPACEREGDTGLLACLELELDALVRIDGLALRLTETGKLAISFPKRSSRSGSRHAVVRPIDGIARITIERTILRALGVQAELEAHTPSAGSGGR